MAKQNVGVMNQMTGKAGEYAVAAQLVLRGETVFFPSVDTGVDLMTLNGCRIQVKTAHVLTSQKMRDLHGENCYIFVFNHKKKCALSNSRIVVYPSKVPSTYCDVMVFWGIEHNRFWIAPSHLCDSRYCFRLGEGKPSRYVGSEAQLREMVALGYTHDEIAAQYGISRSRVTVMLNHPETIATQPAHVNAIRACENAWENIINFDPAKRGQKVVGPEAAREEVIE